MKKVTLQQKTKKDTYQDDSGPPHRTPRWVKFSGIISIVLVVLYVVLYLTGIVGIHGMHMGHGV